MSTVRTACLAGLAALALAGCGRTDRQAPAPAESLVPLPSAQPAPPEPATPAEDQCGAGKVGRYLNQPHNSQVADDIRKAIGHERIRTIRPGDAVTMDMRPDRLNVEIGEDGRIARLRCG